MDHALDGPNDKTSGPTPGMAKEFSMVQEILNTHFAHEFLRFSQLPARRILAANVPVLAATVLRLESSTALACRFSPPAPEPRERLAPNREPFGALLGLGNESGARWKFTPKESRLKLRFTAAARYGVQLSFIASGATSTTSIGLDDFSQSCEKNADVGGYTAGVYTTTPGTSVLVERTIGSQPKETLSSLILRSITNYFAKPTAWSLSSTSIGPSWENTIGSIASNWSLMSGVRGISRAPKLILRISSASNRLCVMRSSRG